MLLLCQISWFCHVIRMPDSKLPNRMLYSQLRLGHRSIDRQKKRFKDHTKSILISCNIPLNGLDALTSNRATWRSTCAIGMSCFDAEYNRGADLRRSRSAPPTYRFCSPVSNLWQIMLITHWPPQPQ